MMFSICKIKLGKTVFSLFKNTIQIHIYYIKKIKYKHKTG